MKIVTFTLCGNQDGEVRAMTLEEYHVTPGALADYEEYVWQDQPSKETAIARHETAHALWYDDQTVGRPEKDTY